MRLPLLALLLTSCATPHEGEFIGPFEGMAWAVDCSNPNMLHDIHERWEYENPNWCDANLEPDESYSMCAEWMRVRYRYEWAKAEYREKCEGEL